MPPAETTRGLDEGIRAEIRVAQAWFWDGYYVRRGIDLQHRFGYEISTVTAAPRSRTISGSPGPACRTEQILIRVAVIVGLTMSDYLASADGDSGTWVSTSF